jgi:hypothetical protein
MSHWMQIAAAEIAATRYIRCVRQLGQRELGSGDR